MESFHSDLKKKPQAPILKTKDKHPSVKLNEKKPTVSTKDKIPVQLQPSFTFAVDNVEQNKSKYSGGYSAEAQFKLQAKCKAKIEDFSHKNDRVTNFLPSEINNGVMNAIHYAYINHCPLKLSVTDFILMIGQGIAKHMEVHAEDLREHFVDFKGKKEIVILRPDLIPGKKNNWSTVFGDFSAEIQKKVKTDLYDVLIDDTSVATKVSKIASEIAIMDAYKQYFEYVVRMGCGFPKITLVGSNEDWEKLRNKVKKLQEMNADDKLKLNWWLERLVPLVDSIVDQATSRNIDKAFWSNLYHSQKHGGFYVPTPMISGWIIVFHPYLERNSMNGGSGKPLKELFRSSFDEIHPSNLTSGISKVPFLWRDEFNKDTKMNIYGGCLGAQMLKCTTVEPVYFYAVTYEEESKSPIKGQVKTQ